MTFIVLSTREAKKTLSDGRNAHLIVKSPIWWIKKFEGNFDILVVHFKKDVSELKQDFKSLNVELRGIEKDVGIIKEKVK